MTWALLALAAYGLGWALTRRRACQPPDLPGPIVSGHRGRCVRRVTLPGGGVAYLKVDRRFCWGEAPCAREARMLGELARAGAPVPRVLGSGPSFLLLAAVEGSAPLTEHLEVPERRRPLARALGRLIARLHAAGFTHRDLWAKHVLISGGQPWLIDCQRAARGGDPVRDLATLDATVPEELASLRDRLALLRAYLGGSRGLRELALKVREMAERLQRKRHVREKRCPTQAGQTWTCLDGEALCVTPEMDGDTEWLALQRQHLPQGQTATRRWIERPGGRRQLLVRRRERAVGASASMRQANLLWRLQRHGVEAPRVLAAGERPEPGGLGSFLLSEPPAGAVSLAAWLRIPVSDRGPVLRAVGEMVRRMHEGCCYLGEQGLSALGVCGPRAVLLTAEGLTPAREPDEARQTRDWVLLRGLVEPLAGSEGWRMMSNVLGPARPMNLGPSGPWRRWSRGVWRVWSREDWDHLAGDGWLGRVLSMPVTDRFHEKQGRSTGRLILERDGQRVVVYLKRHYQLPWWHRLMALAWPGSWSPALQERDNLEWARSQGVPVPNVVAAGEKAGPGLTLTSFLAVEELTGMLPLHEAVPRAAQEMPPGPFQAWKRGLVKEMARLTRLLHGKHRFHKDLYLCHFYVHEEDLRPGASWRGRVFLIDLHRLGHHPWTWRWWQLKDLAQLLYSSDVLGVTPRDRVAFWRAYLGKDVRSARWLRWWVLLRWRRYRQHNLRRKAASAEGCQP
jgi:heptose I phosphotransferase